MASADLMTQLQDSVAIAQAAKSADNPVGIRQKLLAIMREVSYIQKDKKNEHFRYSYASEAAIKTAMHAALVKYGVLFKLSQSGIAERPSGSGKETITTIHNVYEFIDVETGEREAGEFYGSGSDGADKGCYKATTGAIKYILTSMFLIPTGDDPEKDAPKTKAEKKAEQDEIRKRYDQQHGPAYEQSKGKPVELINEAQRKRLYAIATEAQKPKDVVKVILKEWGFDSSRDVTTDKYDNVVASIQKPLKIVERTEDQGLPDPFEVDNDAYVRIGKRLYRTNDDASAWVEMK